MAKAVADIRSLARSHTRTAIRTLRMIMVTKDAPAASRVAAASELLNRGWGKPQQNHGGSDGEKEILVTIRHLVEGMPDTQKVIDITPDEDDSPEE